MPRSWILEFELPGCLLTGDRRGEQLGCCGTNFMASVSNGFAQPSPPPSTF